MKNWRYRFSLNCWHFQRYRGVALYSAKVDIGTDPTYRTVLNQKCTGELVGFDIDLARLCGLSAQCAFVRKEAAGCADSVFKSESDAIMSSLTITEKRQRNRVYRRSFYAADSRLVVAKNSDIQPTIASLKGKRVRRATGTQGNR